MIRPRPNGDSPASAGRPEYRQGGVVPAARAPRAVRTYFEALNREDWAGLAPLWTADAELRAVGARPRRGRDEIMGYCQNLFGPWSAHTDEPTRVIVADDLAVVEIEFRGVTRDGRTISFDAVDVFELSGESVRRLSIWYDLSWLRRQL